MRPILTLIGVVILGTVLVILLGCNQSNQSNRSGERYLSDLNNLIEKADSIEVVEHSSPMDFLDSEKNEDIDVEEKSYKRVKLSKQQKDGFASSIRALDPTTQDAFPACIIEAHHRIEFFVNDKLIDAMEVCFACGQVEWRGSKQTPPWALYSGLESFISSIGMQAKRDWIALASGDAK